MDFNLAFEKLLNSKGLRSPGPAHKISDEFEDSLLGVEGVPAKHFDFVCKVLSDQTLLARRGLEYLVMALFSNRDKLSAKQLEEFVSCIKQNYGLVTDETLAVALCDFITRTLAPSDGLSVIGVLTREARSSAAIAGVLVGIDILRREARTSKAIKLDAIDSVASVAQEKFLAFTSTREP